MKKMLWAWMALWVVGCAAPGAMPGGGGRYMVMQSPMNGAIALQITYPTADGCEFVLGQVLRADAGTTPLKPTCAQASSSNLLAARATLRNVVEGFLIDVETRYTADCDQMVDQIVGASNGNVVVVARCAIKDGFVDGPDPHVVASSFSPSAPASSAQPAGGAPQYYQLLSMQDNATAVEVDMRLPERCESLVNSTRDANFSGTEHKAVCTGVSSANALGYSAIIMASGLGMVTVHADSIAACNFVLQKAPKIYSDAVVVLNCAMKK